MAEKKIPGTSISESAMEKMLRHNRELVGGGDQPATVDHQQIAEGIRASQPVLLPGVGAPRIAASRVRTEGVQGTSPTPGQDNIDYIPPTTSNTADPGNIPAKGPDAENEPASNAGPRKSRAEQLNADISTLFAEGENPFAKKDDKDGDEDEDHDEPDGDENGEDTDGDGDGKDKKDDKDELEGEGVEPVDEAVEVHCESCGYEETYELSEAAIAEGQVPLTPDGKLNNKCPMCGADMDLSMIGATNVGEIGDPNPRTDARGNSGPTESVSPEAVRAANVFMGRVVAGEAVEDVAKSIIEGDFLERKAKKRQMVGATC